MSRQQGRKAGPVALVCLVAALSLAACGDATQVGVSNGTTNRTAASGTQVPVNNNTTPNVSPTGGVKAEGTVGQGGSTGARSTADADGSRISGTAGTGIKPIPGTAGAGALSPVAEGAGISTPNATSQPSGAQAPAVTAGVTVGSTPTQTTAAGGVPVYGGAQAVTLNEAQQAQVIQGYNNLKGLIGGSQVQFYRLPNLSDSNRVVDFYRAQLQPQGWVDRTVYLSQIKEFGLVTFFNLPPSLFTKGDQVLLVGASRPLGTEDIQAAGLGNLFQTNDVAIMTLLGTSKFKVQ